MTIPKTNLTVLSSSKIGVKASCTGMIYWYDIYGTLVFEERPKKKTLNSSEKQPQNIPL